MNKTQEVEAAALKLRVRARKLGYMTEVMAWDAIAEVQSQIDTPPAISAKSVIRKAQAEFKANGENLEVR